MVSLGRYPSYLGILVPSASAAFYYHRAGCGLYWPWNFLTFHFLAFFERKALLPLGEVRSSFQKMELLADGVV
jgi:hypothetical protein